MTETYKGLGILQKQLLTILSENEWVTTAELTIRVFPHRKSAQSPQTILVDSLKRLEARGLCEGRKINMMGYTNRKIWQWKKTRSKNND